MNKKNRTFRDDGTWFNTNVREARKTARWKAKRNEVIIRRAERKRAARA